MKRFVLLTWLIFSGITFNTLTAQHWEWVNPLPCNNVVRDIFMADSQNGIICGNSGIILKTTDGGITWHQKYSGVSNDLYKT